VIISDEVYREYVYDGEKQISMLEFPELKEIASSSIQNQKDIRCVALELFFSNSFSIASQCSNVICTS
jgi:hypothetical protein